MTGLINSVYRSRLRENPLADTPLLSAAIEEKAGLRFPEPPKRVPTSRTQMESFERMLERDRAGVTKITRRQQTVLDAIKLIGPATTEQLATNLDWTINLVSGRIAELQQQGYVLAFGAVRNAKTGRRNSLWKAI